MKRITKIITTALALLIVCIAAIAPVSATYEYKGSFEHKEGGFLGIGATSYTYKVYRDNIEAYLMYHSKDVCPPVYHTKDRGTIELSYTNSISISSQTAFNFSKSLGLEVGIEELVKLAASASNGLEFTTGITVTASGTVGKTLPADSPTGYYKFTPCQNFHQRRLDKYKTGSTVLLSSEHCFIPEGKTYLASLYSKDNSSYARY